MIKQFYLLIDRTQTSITTPGQGGSGSYGNSSFLKDLGLKPHHQMQFNVISRTLVGEESLTLCRGILQPQPIGQSPLLIKAVKLI